MFQDKNLVFSQKSMFFFKYDGDMFFMLHCPGFLRKKQKTNETSLATIFFLEEITAVCSGVYLM